MARADIERGDIWLVDLGKATASAPKTGVDSSISWCLSHGPEASDYDSPDVTLFVSVGASIHCSQLELFHRAPLCSECVERGF